MARSPRGPTFFACAKKVGKESTPRSSRPSRCAAGVRVAGGNFGTAHPVPTQNAAHPCAAPCGFTHRRHRCGWGPRANAKAKALVHLSLTSQRCYCRCCCCSSGPRSGVANGPGKTRRAAHRTCAVSGRGRMPLPEIPLAANAPSVTTNSSHARERPRTSQALPRSFKKTAKQKAPLRIRRACGPSPCAQHPPASAAPAEPALPPPACGAPSAPAVPHPGPTSPAPAPTAPRHRR